jgi:hypothetical protein
MLCEIADIFQLRRKEMIYLKIRSYLHADRCCLKDIQVICGIWNGSIIATVLQLYPRATYQVLASLSN